MSQKLKALDIADKGDELRTVYAEAVRDTPDDMLDLLEVIDLRYITIIERNRQTSYGNRGGNMRVANKAI